MQGLSAETQETTLFGTFVATFIVLTILAAFGLVFVIKSEEPIENNVLCPPPEGTQCQAGISFPTVDNVNVCEYWARKPATVCESTCHANTTTTRCDKYGVCGSTDPTACLGYCALTGTNLITRGHADCEDKLTFKSYFVPGATGAAATTSEYLFFSNFTDICHFDGGCHWFGAYIQLYQTASPSSYLTAQGNTRCPYFLNMTNAECIDIQEIDLNDALSIKLLEPYSGTPTVTQALGCLYSYKCGTRNETKLDDAVLLKRQVADPVSNVAHIFRAAYNDKMPEIRSAVQEKLRRRRR